MIATRSICYIFLIAFSTIGFAQSTNPAPIWIDSVQYGVTAPGPDQSLEIHVALNGSAQTPCGSNAIVLDDLVIDDNYVDPAPDDKRTIAVYKSKQPESSNASPASFKFHLPIGTRAPLPDGWKRFSFRLTAHCEKTSIIYSSPLITISRSLYQQDNALDIKPNDPDWYKSRQDTVKLTVSSPRPVRITDSAIRDDEDATHHNIISEHFSETNISTSRTITFAKFVEAVQTDHPYVLIVNASDDGLPIHKELPFRTHSPRLSYTIDNMQPASPVIVTDISTGYVDINVLTNAVGTLQAKFENLSPGGNSLLSENSTTPTREHVLHVDIRGIKDGEYGFTLVGIRGGTPNSDPLIDGNRYVLKIDTTVHVVGPIGLKLQEGKTLSFTYCLSRKTPGTKVEIHKTTGKNSMLISQIAPISIDCEANKDAAGYQAQQDLSIFVTNLKKKPDNSSNTDSPDSTSSSMPTANQPSQPVTIHIHDAKGSEIASINLDAVSIPDNAAVVQALQKITDKNASSTDKDKAQNTLQTSLKGSGLTDDQIKSLIDSIRRRGNGAGGQIATVLTTVLQGVAKAYLGIPTAK